MSPQQRQTAADLTAFAIDQGGSAEVVADEFGVLVQITSGPQWDHEVTQYDIAIDGRTRIL